MESFLDVASPEALTYYKTLERLHHTEDALAEAALQLSAVVASGRDYGRELSRYRAASTRHATARAATDKANAAWAAAR